MTVIKILTWIAALGMIFLGLIFILSSIINQGQTNQAIIGLVNVLIGIGLIIIAIRRVKPPLSEKQMGLSLAAGFLLLLGDFFIIYAFAEEIRVGGFIFALLCIGGGFALIWYAQLGSRPAVTVSEEPIHAIEPFQGGETAVTGDSIHGEIALFRGAPIEVEKSPAVHKRRWVLGGVIAGSVIGCGILVLCFVYLVRATVHFEGAGVALEYPRTWKQLDPSQVDIPDQELIIALTPPKGNGLFKVSRWPVEGKSKANFSTRMDEAIQADPAARLLSKEEIPLGGQQATRWIYTGVCPGYPDRTCKYLTIITENDHYCYVPGYIDDPAPFDQNWPDVEKILASIKF